MPVISINLVELQLDLHGVADWLLVGVSGQPHLPISRPGVDIHTAVARKSSLKELDPHLFLDALTLVYFCLSPNAHACASSKLFFGRYVREGERERWRRKTYMLHGELARGDCWDFFPS